MYGRQANSRTSSANWRENKDADGGETGTALQVSAFWVLGTEEEVSYKLTNEG
jgi:hypothetical protein